VGRWHYTLLAVSLAGAMLAMAATRAMAQPRAHVYLFRGLADVFSQGMDTLADELNKRGVYATSHSHTDWKTIADKAAISYKAGKEGPIVIVGHSLGADAAMEMADYLGDKGVPIALVVPFDGTQSFPVPGNVARVINFTQRDYAFMRPGPGFRGSLTNVDLRGDPNIDHLNIDESPKLHSQVISAVLAITGGHVVSPARAKPSAVSSNGNPKAKQIGLPAQGSADGGTNTGDMPSSAGERGSPVAGHEGQTERPANPVAPAPPPPKAPLQAAKPGSPVQIRD
jgi:hypothetical protein